MQLARSQVLFVCSRQNYGGAGGGDRGVYVTVVILFEQNSSFCGGGPSEQPAGRGRAGVSAGALLLLTQSMVVNSGAPCVL